MGSILVVEADPEVCGRWAAAVTAAGHAVLTAAAMHSAISVIRDGGIDVVVICAYEPLASVSELARNIEALPDAPPMILVSGSPEAPELSARIGAAVFLPKPCEAAELVAAIGQLLRMQRPVRIVEDEPTAPTDRTRLLG